MSDNVKSTVEQTSENTLVIERIFDAPRQQVWQAWTEAEHMQRWWGPEGFTAPVIQMDLREGGKYLFCMRSLEGQDNWSASKDSLSCEPLQPAMPHMP